MGVGTALVLWLLLLAAVALVLSRAVVMAYKRLRFEQRVDHRSLEEVIYGALERDEPWGQASDYAKRRPKRVANAVREWAGEALGSTRAEDDGYPP